MQRYVIYLLVPVMATLLVSAQAVWGSAIKHGGLMRGSPGHILINLITSPGIWLGAFLYMLTTLVYFVMLSRGKFFIIQLSMAAISIILSTLLSAILFKEHLNPINIAGMFVVIAGLACVMR